MERSFDPPGIEEHVPWESREWFLWEKYALASFCTRWKSDNNFPASWCLAVQKEKNLNQSNRTMSCVIRSCLLYYLSKSFFKAVWSLIGNIKFWREPFCDSTGLPHWKTLTTSFIKWRKVEIYSATVENWWSDYKRLGSSSNAFVCCETTVSDFSINAICWSE